MRPAVENREKVLGYYNRFESRVGYRFIKKLAKHFGFYPTPDAKISEQEAQQLMSDEVVKKLDLKPGQLVLDAGCGYGITPNYLARKHNIVLTGIDLSNKELSDANKRQDSTDKASFSVADYSNLPFSNNTFDSIITMESLSHAPDLEAVLKEFLRVLKPGGKISLSEYTLAPNDKFSKEDLEMIELIIENTVTFGLKEFKHDKFSSYLERIGFIDAKEQDITNNVIPSLKKLGKLALIPYYFFIKYGFKKFFINTTIGIEWLKMIDKGLIRHSIFTAQKQKN